VGSTDIALDTDDTDTVAKLEAVASTVQAAPVKESAGPSREQQKELSRIETKIKQLQDEKASLQASFLKEGSDADTLVANGKALDAVVAGIEEKEMEWLELTETIEGN
jgi:ATP-binding cassette subfamily F protein uup